MQCRKCKRDIPDNSIYCNWCGQKQIKDAKEEIHVPEPRILSSGKAFIQLRINGRSISITEDTPALCKAKARAIKAGLLDAKKNPQNITVGEAIDEYIASGDNLLSPSTIRSYKAYRRNRFQALMLLPISQVNETLLQKMVNEEMRLVSPKTVKNVLYLIIPALSRQKDNLSAQIDFDKILKPKTIKKKRIWLDPDQILVFLKAVENSPYEMFALLALHSLRRSEIMGLTYDDIDLSHNNFSVSKSVVADENNKLVLKASTKTTASQRVIPIMIPRLRVLLEESLNCSPAVSSPVITYNPSSAYKHINRICESVGLLKVGIHGLRHSFASLAYHLGMSELEAMTIGGWSDYKTMRGIYTHLSERDRKNAENKMTEFYKNAN